MIPIFNKFGRLLLFTVFVGVSFYVITPVTFAQSQEQVLNFNAKYFVKETGVVSIEEIIDYHFATPRHGIFRNILYEKKNDTGARYLLDIKNISVKMDSNTDVPYTIEKAGKYYQVKIGDANITITGNHQYIISYDVYGALTYFKDHDEFYWNVSGNEWEVPISMATASVAFEPYMEERDLKSICYTGTQGSTAQNCQSITTKTPTVTIQTVSQLNPSEGLTIAISFPKGKVAQLEPHKDIWGMIITIVLMIAGAIWYVFLPFYAFYLYLKEKNNVKNKQRIVAAWFDPPKKLNGESFSPAETGYIQSKNINNKFITATIIQLAQKGFLKIKVESKNDITFIKTEKTDTLASFEQDLLDGLFSKTDGGEIKLKDLKTSTKLAKQVAQFKDHVSKSIKAEKLFKYDPMTYSGVVITLGLLVLFLTGNFLLGLICLVFLRTAAPRTDLGIEKYSEAVSLKNFLESQDAQLDFQAEKQMFFEKLLPYATAFGVEDVWIKRFGNLDIRMPDWYEGDMTNFYALSAINHSIASAVGSSVSYASGSHSSSGFSSGFSGGSSGGGGGGGGGGSW
ncbi:DUF2207 domain-containing protein [candidate division WWE3 bacterium]|uniref:DUF2207 domain-containing protein n=1 Tax=candidate division WWE3 bacterium TaxID=2053526 RepID=A0A7X9DK21_UNCKA|nr:DUF2207 domain-containing protein [candidate division WWE3 bacterium]